MSCAMSLICILPVAMGVTNPLTQSWITVKSSDTELSLFHTWVAIVLAPGTTSPEVCV